MGRNKWMYAAAMVIAVPWLVVVFRAWEYAMDALIWALWTPPADPVDRQSPVLVMALFAWGATIWAFVYWSIERAPESTMPTGEPPNIRG